MIFRTQSGSTYEIELENKRIRRLDGKKAATSRQGKDGEWKTYDTLIPETPTVGMCLWIFHDPNIVKPLHPDNGGIPATTTSIITSIVDEKALS